MVEKWKSKYKRFVETAFREVKRVLRPYSGKFSKKTYTQHQHAVAILLMKYEKKTYRDTEDLLTELRRYFHFGSILDYSTLQKFFKRIPLYIWEFLLEKTYQLFNADNANVAVDATGFMVDRSSYYYEMRVFHTIRKRRCMKHSIIVDTDRQAIMGSSSVISKASEIKKFKPLVRRANRLTKINIITADKGYDSEENHRFSHEEIGALSIIPLRRRAKSLDKVTGRYRKQLAVHFPEKLYHQRSKVETINAVQKKKFGDTLRSKILTMQKKEMKVIDVVYNLYRYMNLFADAVLGIQHIVV